MHDILMLGDRRTSEVALISSLSFEVRQSFDVEYTDELCANHFPYSAIYVLDDSSKHMFFKKLQ